MFVVFFITNVKKLCTKPLELKTEGPLFNLCVKFEDRLKWISSFQRNE